MKPFALLLAATVLISTGTPEITGQKYKLLYENNSYTYSLYEPRDVCYIGADIITGRKIPLEIKEFERLTKKSHGIYLNTMRVNDPFPLKWILGCIAEMRTPCVIVEPFSSKISDVEPYLEKLADSFGEYYVPIFVQLLPVSRNYDSKEYIEIFHKAHKIFKERASNVALVFTVNGYDALDLLSYYPGNDYVDWVGLSIFEAFEQNKEYSYDALKALDTFYYNFQKDKPIMISQLAVSHYSSNDHVYRASRASDEITGIYGAISGNYPRVKCIIYKDFNGVGIGSYKDNFSVTDNPDITDAYAKNISDVHFTSEINLTSMNEIKKEQMLSVSPAYKIDGVYYFAENTLKYDLNLKGLSSYGESITIDGFNYYKSDILKNTSKDFQVDVKKKQIIIKNKS